MTWIVRSFALDRDLFYGRLVSLARDDDRLLFSSVVPFFFSSSAFFLQSLVLKFYLLSCYFLDDIPLILFSLLSLIFPLSSSLSHLLSYLSFLFLASLPPLMHTKPSLRLPSTPSHRNEEIPPPASSRSVLTSKKRANERRTSGRPLPDDAMWRGRRRTAHTRLAKRKPPRWASRRGELPPVAVAAPD